MSRAGHIKGLILAATPHIKTKEYFMKNLELLKGVLKEETYALVEAETKDSDISLADLSKGQYVSKDKYTALETQLTDTQDLLSKKTTEFDELTKTAGDNTALKEQIEQMKTNFENEKEEIQNKANAQLKREKVKTDIINRFKPRDIADVMPHIDIDKITEQDDKLIGIDEQVNPLKENKGYLFGEDEGSGFHHKHESNNKDAFEAGFGD